MIAPGPAGRPPPAERERVLPFSGWIPFAAGAAFGLAMRLIFSGTSHDILDPMAGSFIFLVPIITGMLTVVVAERQRRRSWGYYIWAPAVATALVVMGTLVMLIEGIICAILVVPLFCVFGAVGGLIMGLICRLTIRANRTMLALAPLPILLAPVEAQVGPPERVGDIESSILVAAPSEAVWDEIWNVRDIQPEEVERAWMYRIGVPVPRSGITEVTPHGPIRRIVMGKGIHFDQIVTEWHPNRDVHWIYHFDADSFPPAALDDHVRIGGRYFDLLTTSYTLTPEGDRTRLTIRMGYRISTRFNWYAGFIADELIGNFESVILEFYRARSEHRANREAGT